MNDSNLIRYFRELYPGISRYKTPRWINASRWKPRFCLSIPGDHRIIAVDVIPSAVIPRTLYNEVVKGLVDSHPNLRVIVCVNEMGFESHQELEPYCSRIGIGLKLIVPIIGLQTVCPTDLDIIQSGSGFIEEPGWFPESILQRAMEMRRVSFAKEIKEFVQDVRDVKDRKRKVIDLVFETIDRLLQSQRQCPSSTRRFMKLGHFEGFFRAQPDVTDHVLHSFRVFLAGCCVVDQYYAQFASAHKRFCIIKRPQPEYTWLLASIFHDIGKPKEVASRVASRMLEEELDDEDITVKVKTKKNKWNRDKYKNARTLLASLGTFISTGYDKKTTWDAGAFSDKKDKVLIADWTRIYDALQSHGIISSFDMLADICDKVQQAGQRINRSFVASHAVPAALTILIHDWHIWIEAKKWGLFPIDCKVFPMAGLLIYLDTWDDFRRTNDIARIYVRDFSVDKGGVSVDIEWNSAEEYQKELMKYTAFNKALKLNRFQLRINHTVARH